MSPSPTNDDLDARLDHLEERIEALHDKLGTSAKSGGGIGCLGFALFIYLIIKSDEILDAVQALAS